MTSDQTKNRSDQKLVGIKTGFRIGKDHFKKEKYENILQ